MIHTNCASEYDPICGRGLHGGELGLSQSNLEGSLGAMGPYHEARGNGFFLLADIFTVVYLGTQKKIRPSVGIQQIFSDGRTAAGGLLGHSVGGSGV